MPLWLTEGLAGGAYAPSYNRKEDQAGGKERAVREQGAFRRVVKSTDSGPRRVRDRKPATDDSKSAGRLVLEKQGKRNRGEKKERCRSTGGETATENA